MYLHYIFTVVVVVGGGGVGVCGDGVGSNGGVQVDDE